MAGPDAIVDPAIARPGDREVHGETCRPGPRAADSAAAPLRRRPGPLSRTRKGGGPGARRGGRERPVALSKTAAMASSQFEVVERLPLVARRIVPRQLEAHEGPAQHLPVLLGTAAALPTAASESSSPLSVKEHNSECALKFTAAPPGVLPPSRGFHCG